MTITTRPLSPTLGIEVSGVPMASPLDSDTANSVRELWRRHGLLLFRGQQLEEEDLIAFSRNLGPLETHVRREYLSSKNPEILYVSNMKENGRPIGILADTEVGWHYDQIYLPRP